MSEHEEARILANRILEQPSGDPDGDLAILSRHLLRPRKQISDERMAAFADWEAPKYSTGVHPQMSEVQILARELQQARARIVELERLLHLALASLKNAQVCSRCRHPRVAHCNWHPPIWECSECDCRGGFEEEHSQADVFFPAIAAIDAALKPAEPPTEGA